MSDMPLGRQHVCHEAKVGDASVAAKTIDQFYCAFDRCWRLAGLVFGQEAEYAFLSFALIKSPVVAVQRVKTVGHK